MLTLNGVPTESFQDITIQGDLQVDGAVDFTNQKVLTYEGEVLTHDGEVLTYEDD